MRPLDPLLSAAYEAQAALTHTWLAALTADDLDRPSRLPGWRVAELAAHLAHAPAGTAAALESAAPRGTSAHTAAAHLAGLAAAADEIAVQEVAAAQGLSAVTAAATFELGAGRVRAATAALGDADPVVLAGRRPLRASDLLRLGVLGLTVHSLDADGGPARDRQAVRVCVRLLVEILAERHPGRAVEVRVPPYAAAQVGEGVTHTRGTPPNVVEMSPEVFLAVASGRRPWDDAAAAGEVRASGSRADLTPYLPLL